jgi:integrase
MAIEKLSGTFIRKVTKNGLHADGGNLYLQVTNGGTGKSWLFRWTDRRTKRQRSMGLGTDTAKARDKAKSYRQWLSDGKDPWAEREAARLESEITAGEAKTVRDLVDEFYAAKIKHLSPHTRKSFNGIIGRHVLCKIGDMPIATVTRNHCLDTIGLRKLWESKHGTAEQLLSYLQRMFSLAIEEGYCGNPKPSNPLDWEGLKHVLPDRKRVHKIEHHPALRYQDAGRFMRDLRAYKDRSVRKTGHPARALWLEFVVLTGVRVSEARLATWSEVRGLNTPNPVWVVPAAHHKIGHITEKPHEIPVTKPMLAILDEMRRRHGDNPNSLVFPSPYGLKHGKPRPFDVGSANTFIKGCLKWNVHITAHGFRSCVTDWAIANGYPEGLVDLQVGHLPRGKVAQAYRRDPLTEARRPMMEAWGVHCATPPVADNVVHGTFNRAKEVA